MRAFEFGNSSNPLPPKKFKKHILGASVLLSALALSETFASNINLNDESAIEFGQGFTRATACDGDIILSLNTTFKNQANIENISNSGEDNFFLGSISVSGIDSSIEKCSGKFFQTTVYGAGAIKLDSFYIYNTGEEFTSEYGTVESDFSNLENTSFAITLDDPYVLASEIINVTIESVDSPANNDSFLNGVQK
jgi:hypothetical protein